MWHAIGDPDEVAFADRPLLARCNSRSSNLPRALGLGINHRATRHQYAAAINHIPDVVLRLMHLGLTRLRSAQQNPRMVRRPLDQINLLLPLVRPSFADVLFYLIAWNEHQFRSLLPHSWKSQEQSQSQKSHFSHSFLLTVRTFHETGRCFSYKGCATLVFFARMGSNPVDIHSSSDAQWCPNHRDVGNWQEAIVYGLRYSAGVRIAISRQGCNARRSASPVMIRSAFPFNETSRNLSSPGSRHSRTS